jgi:ADP-heptose:LPS heptosyltransferase
MERRVKILIIKPSSLGDIIHGLQIAATIKDRLPNVSIDWVVRDCFEDIVRVSSIVENMFIFHRRCGFLKFIKLLSEVRKVHYDYVFDMQGLARTGAMTYFAKADRKIGRSDAREFAWLAYDKKIQFPGHIFPHAIDILLQFLPELGLEAKLETRLKFSTALSHGVKNSLHRENGKNSPMILLFPESRRREKEWPYFSIFAPMLAERFPNFLTIIISQKPFNLGREFPNICNLSGKTSLDDVIHLVQNSNLVIGNDSAPIHLAAAVEVPLIALFGPTDPKRFGPYPVGNGNNRVLRSVDGILASISPADVLFAAVSLLQRS